jgi:hypothetical protein
VCVCVCVCVLREANYLTVEPKASRPISLFPLIHHAAARDINKPIKGSKGVEVSWPEFPSGILLPEMLLLLSDHQYGTPTVPEICIRQCRGSQKSFEL